MDPTTMLHPTAETFEQEVLGSPVPVLVDFWAPWCPPCRMLKPELEKLAVELGSSARIATVNVDDEPELAQRFNVTGIPFLALIKNGKVVDEWTGYAPQAAMSARVRAHVSSAG